MVYIAGLGTILINLQFDKITDPYQPMERRIHRRRRSHPNFKNVAWSLTIISETLRTLIRVPIYVQQMVYIRPNLLVYRNGHIKEVEFDIAPTFTAYQLHQTFN